MHWTEISERRHGDVVILDARGDLTMCESPGRLFVVIDRLAQQGDCRILLNLSHVAFIDSHGLADIVEGFKAAKAAGGVLKLCEIVDRIRRLLVTTRLASVIEIFDSEQDALKSFDKDRG